MLDFIIALATTLTIYHAVPSQTDSTPNITASGYVIKDVENPKPIAAVSWDLDVAFGEWIFIKCDCPYDGMFVEVQDCMNSRWNNRVDILVPLSVKNGKYEVKIFLIPKYEDLW